MSADGAGSEHALNFSNSISVCQCHDVPCTWSDTDSFHFVYRFELQRRHSFLVNECRTWPHDSPKWDAMASAGFFYTGISDFVRCFEYCLLVGNWNLLRGVSPMIVHASRSVRCRFVQRVPCGNVPLGFPSNVLINSMLRTHNDILVMYGDVIQANERLPGYNLVSYSLDHIDSSISGVVYDARVSQCPQYARYSDRLRSFCTWPVTKVQTKEAMSYAGFYYTGKDDEIQCYHCGLELRDWQPEDHPLLQHIKMSSKCMHIMKVVEEIISTKTARL